MLTNPAHALGGASHKQEQQIDKISHVYLLFICSDDQKVRSADIHVPVTEGVVQYTEEPAPTNGDRCCRSSHLVDAPQAGLLSLIHISEPTRLGMISYAVFCLK